MYFLLVRYDDSASARHVENQKGDNENLKENLDKYPREWTCLFELRANNSLLIFCSQLLSTST